MSHEVYEVANPSFRDINLEQQIEFGICDWVVRFANGREIFGETKQKALRNAGLI